MQEVSYRSTDFSDRVSESIYYYLPLHASGSPRYDKFLARKPGRAFRGECRRPGVTHRKVEKAAGNRFQHFSSHAT
jgi:hypothetical protein